MISDNDFAGDTSDLSQQSETSEISKIITENAQLRELNSQMNSDLKNLRTQFDDAVGVFQKIEDVNKENISLKQQLLKSKEDVDDLNQRLRIIMQNSNELSNNVQSTRAVTDREHQDEIAELQAQIYDLQSKNKLETDRLKTKLRNSDEISMKIQTDNAVLKNQVGKIMSLSQNFFKHDFLDVQDLIDFLMHPMPELEFDRPTISKTNEDLHQHAEDRKKLKNLKDKLEKEKAQRKQLELEVLQIRKAAEVESAKQAEKIIDTENLKRKYENEVRKLNADHQREIVIINQRLNNVKKLHVNIGMQTSTALVDETISNTTNTGFEGTTKETEVLKSRLREAQNTLSQLQSQTDAYQSQIVDDDKMKEKVRRKLQASRAKAEQLQKDLRDSQKQIAILASQLDQCNEEKAVLEDQVKMIKATHDDTKVRCDATKGELDSLKKSIEYLEELTDAQSTEIAQLTHDRDHLLSLVHTQSQCLYDTESIIDNLQKSVKENESRTCVYAQQEEPNSPSEWDFGTLPEELKDILRELANNDGMEIEKRIRHIFSVVSKWFDNTNSDHEALVNELNDKLQNTNRTITTFATSLLQAIEQDSLDLNEIVESVSNLYKEKMTLEQRLNEISASPVYFDQATYNEMNDTIQSLRKIAKDLKGKEKQRKAELRECKAAFVECQKKSQEQLDTLQEANSKAHLTINDLQQQLDELHAQHKALLDELGQVKDVHSNDYLMAQSEIETVRMEHSSQLEDLKLECGRQVRNRDEQLFLYRNKIKELESSLKQWEEICRKSTDETRKLKNQLNQIQISKDEQISQITRQKDKEVQQLEDHYQTMIEALRVKSNETEVIVQSMQKGFEENEKKMRNMTSQVAQLTFQLQKADLKAQSQLDSAERSKKLIVAQLRAQLMAVETKYSVFAEEQKHNWESEKRALFGFLAQQFGAFFDAKQALNEDSFKQVVSKIKNEIERHKKQELTIRRLLKVKENQTTEDALADLVFSLHPQLQKKTVRY